MDDLIQMPRKLCDVTQSFQISGRGLIVTPGPPFHTFGSDRRFHECPVLVKRPDGTEMVIQAQFCIPFFEPMKAMKRFMDAGNYECILLGVDKLEVPLGSQIFEIEAE